MNEPHLIAKIQLQLESDFLSYGSHRQIVRDDLLITAPERISALVSDAVTELYQSESIIIGEGSRSRVGNWPG